MNLIAINSREEKFYDQAMSTYLEAFPFNERRSLGQCERMLCEPEYSLVVAVDEDKFVGFISLWRTEEFTFVEHFAIASDVRGKGYGGKIIDEVVKSSGNLPIILEIEVPVDDTTRARKRFYEKHGFEMFDVFHVQTKFHKDDDEFELKIMSKPEIKMDTYLKFRDYIFDVCQGYCD